MTLQDENLASALHTIFKDAVRQAILSNRAQGVPNIFTKGNSLACEYKHKVTRYRGQIAIDKWIETVMYDHQSQEE